MRCPKCSSKLTYIRRKTQELVCRSCPAITPLAEIPKEKKEETHK